MDKNKRNIANIITELNETSYWIQEVAEPINRDELGEEVFELHIQRMLDNIDTAIKILRGMEKKDGKQYNRKSKRRSNTKEDKND